MMVIFQSGASDSARPNHGLSEFLKTILANFRFLFVR